MRDLLGCFFGSSRSCGGSVSVCEIPLALKRQLPERELDRQVVVLIGSGARIGKATAHRVVSEGAHVVCVDLDETAAKTTADEIIEQYGAGIVVAVTWLSKCGPAAP